MLEESRPIKMLPSCRTYRQASPSDYQVVKNVINFQSGQNESRQVNGNVTKLQNLSSSISK